MKVHQIWISGDMSPRFRAWTDTAKAWAQEMGADYKLWTWSDLLAEFGKEPEAETLSRCMETLPTATAYTFAADYYRLRIIAEYGGIYLDTDARCQHTICPPESPGLYVGAERFDPSLPSTWLLWAHGEQGIAAARMVLHEARKLFAELLPHGAADVPQRFIAMARRDRAGGGLAANGLGPVVFRRSIMPVVMAAGYKVAMLPPEIASGRNEGAALKHCNAGSWLERGADWNARAARAAELSTEQPPAEDVPEWQRPQSRRQMPQAIKRRMMEPKLAESALEDGLNIPAGTRRIVIFSNVTRNFDPRALPLRAGDHCIHINRARQFFKVADTPGVTHALVVRKGTGKQFKRVKWYDPPTSEGFLQVLHIADVPMRKRRPWWREYCQRNARRCPTSGFICWHLAREAAPTVPVVLAGFAPGEKFGTPQWRGHAWEYEAQTYARAGAEIVRPDSAGMAGNLPRIKYLVMVCTGMQHEARRNAVRATWAKNVPEGVAVRFYCGAKDAPHAADEDSPDMVRLPGISHAQGALPAAHIEMMRWALKNYDFSYLFKCDDDTFTALDRLASYTPPQSAAMIGNPDPVKSAVALSGGAGYIIHRGWVERLVFNPGPQPWKIDDVYISQEVQRLGGVLMPERRFYHPHDKVPAPGNRQITAHWCKPADMWAIMEGLTK